MIRSALLVAALLACVSACSSSTPRVEPVEVVPPVTGAAPPLPSREPVHTARPLGVNVCIEAALEPRVLALVAEAKETIKQLRLRQAGLIEGPRPAREEPQRQRVVKPGSPEEPGPEDVNSNIWTMAPPVLEQGPRTTTPEQAFECVADASDALVRCARLVHLQNAADVIGIDKALQLAEAGNCPGPARTLALLQREALEITRDSARTAGARSLQYGFYAGPSFSLGGDGNWKEGAEFMARFNTEAFRKGVWGTDWSLPAGWWYRGYTEVSYQTLNALEEVTTTTDETSSDPLAAVASTGEQLDNPFATPDAYLRLNLGLQLHLTDWFGFQLGTGLSSVPNRDDLTDLEARTFGGLHFESLFGDGAYGGVFVGYAYDKFWEREVAENEYERNFHRGNVDLFFIFPPEVLGTRAVTRVFFDTPLSGKGPSEVRASVLLYYSLTDWIGLFAPLRGATARVSGLTGSLGVPGL